jgi:predicted DNA-binding antitoxin AbrB/MazE fold protein
LVTAKSVYQNGSFKKKKEVLEKTGKFVFVVIKPSDRSNYKNMVAVLDEINITNIDAYGIVDITPSEVADLQKNNLYNENK